MSAIETFPSLPAEILLAIIPFLDAASLASWARVSEYHHQFTTPILYSHIIIPPTSPLGILSPWIITGKERGRKEELLQYTKKVTIKSSYEEWNSFIEYICEDLELAKVDTPKIDIAPNIDQFSRILETLKPDKVFLQKEFPFTLMERLPQKLSYKPTTVLQLNGDIQLTKKLILIFESAKDPCMPRPLTMGQYNKLAGICIKLFKEVEIIVVSSEDLCYHHKSSKRHEGNTSGAPLRSRDRLDDHLSRALRRSDAKKAVKRYLNDRMNAVRFLTMEEYNHMNHNKSGGDLE